MINKEGSTEIQKDVFNEINTSNLIVEDDSSIEIKETLSLANQEKNLIIKSLEKHNGKRKLAAEELGISERTLYRKIKEFDL